LQVCGNAIALAARADIDVLIDCCSDAAVSLAAVRTALARGAKVVTASKVLAGPNGADLSALAQGFGTTIRWGAAVGGGVPVVEAAAALVAAGERVTAVRGVINGTCNFVLDRLAQGMPLGEAVRAAQQRGLAEADPAADLSGLDAARKLIVLAREVFDFELALDDVTCVGIEELTPRIVQQISEGGRTLRLVATLQRKGDWLEASVRPVELSPSDPLAGARNEENVFVLTVEGADRPVVLRGLGAGRWPTTEAVVGDVLQIDRERRRPAVERAAAQFERLG
ncbi:MAG: hypothetical protein Q8L55_00125, partial [Phycisphaerales bacterium]|nr:hypothetical protein [Phycisphaerales bacterium]